MDAIEPIPVYDGPQDKGGVTRQQTGDGVATLTTAQGVPVADGQNSLRQGVQKMAVT